MARKKSTKKDTRARNWTFIVYPESTPTNWREVLDANHVPWIESPLHDKDVDPNGEIKKAHWHVVLLFEGKKSYEQIGTITDSIKASIPQVCVNVKGLVRYMAHLDNPEKQQYSVTEIIGHSGADPAIYLRATGIARYEAISAMQSWVIETGCTEFCILVSHAAEEHFNDWFPLLCDNSTYIMNAYIRSFRNSQIEQ